MADKVWTAAELEQMTPEERRAIFQAGIVWDLDEAPPELLARIRARAQEDLDGRRRPLTVDRSTPNGRHQPDVPRRSGPSASG